MDTVEAHAQPYKEDCLRFHATHQRFSTTVFIPLTEVAMAKDTKLIPGTDSGHARNRVTEVRVVLGQQTEEVAIAYCSYLIRTVLSNTSG